MTKKEINDLLTRTGYLQQDYKSEILNYIERLEQTLDEIEEWISDYMDNFNFYDKIYQDLNDLLIIMSKAKGDVKNENNNV